MTHKVILMVGCPASGKSSYAKKEAEILEADGFTTAVISRDYYRKKLIGDTNNSTLYFSHEKEVFRQFVEDINNCLEASIDYIFIDATHISPASRAKVLKCLRPDSSTELEVVVLNPSLDECLRRNAKRTGFELVPDGAIKKMYQDFTFPTISELEQFEFKNKITIVIRNGVE